MKILCSICARKGSTGVKDKNILKINNQPLISHTIAQAKKSKLFDKIVVSTDSEKIKKISKDQNVDLVIDRNKKLSTNTVAKKTVIKDLLLNSEKHFLQKFDIIIDLDVTSPLRKVSDIISALKVFNENKSSNLISVSKAKKNPYFNLIEFKKTQYDLVKKNRKIKYKTRQSSPLVYEANASIYIWNRNNLLRSKKLFGKKTSIYIMPYLRSIDLDDRDDLLLIKYLLKK